MSFEILYVVPIIWVWCAIVRHVIEYLNSPQFKRSIDLSPFENVFFESDSKTLLLKIDNTLDKEIASLYKSQNANSCENSGYDLYVPEDIVFHPFETKFVDHKVKCEMVDENGINIAYNLLPRSSISRTPLILGNSVGLIDAGYRGNIISALRYIPNNGSTDYSDMFVLKKGTRIVQICSSDLRPFDVIQSNDLSESKRGTGGFGSTGN
jgi:dUTP pyrophosphatase